MCYLYQDCLDQLSDYPLLKDSRSSLSLEGCVPFGGSAPQFVNLWLITFYYWSLYSAQTILSSMFQKQNRYYIYIYIYIYMNLLLCKEML
jgi:hypothetical protein